MDHSKLKTLLQNPEFIKRIPRLERCNKIYTSSFPPDANNLHLFDDFIYNNYLSGKHSILHGERIESLSKGPDYLYFRQLQNKDYAIQSVTEGIQYAQAKEYDKALKKYNTALDLDECCVDAWVARGALYANQKKYSQSLSDLKRALELDPQHPNAKIYYEKTKRTFKQIQSEQESAQRGEFLLSDFDSNNRLHSSSSKACYTNDKQPPSSSKLMDLNAFVYDEPERDLYYSNRKHKKKKKHSSLRERSIDKKRRISIDRDVEEGGNIEDDNVDWIERE